MEFITHRIEGIVREEENDQSTLPQVVSLSCFEKIVKIQNEYILK
jgi:hypothetical protein